MKLRSLLLLVAFGFGVGRAAAQDDARIAFFEAKIRPVLVEHCLKCHSETKQRGKLRLDTKAGVLAGGESGQIVVPGKADKSLLVKALRHLDEVKMPPDKKLDDRVVADFVKWIDMGAPDPREGKIDATKGIDWKAARDFWAFQPVRKPEPPKVRNGAWAKTPIDHFILAKLEAEKLNPVRPAGKRELIRRATFDLTGLPPTPDEVEAFAKDEAPNAFDTVIDRLLASPHYGERWGRYWLDVARYAEDQAHTFAVTPNTSAWRYRDWVINAFNEDMPYDRFVKLQIAADFIEKDDVARMKHLPALGFFGLGAQYYKNTDVAKATADELDDRVDTLTRGFLGLTVSCARCHDHKFDPIPTQDYYSLAGVFHSSKLANQTLAPKEKQQVFEQAQAKIKKIDSDMKAFAKVEKTQLAEESADQVGKYLLASWKFQATKQKTNKWSVNDQAKKDKLDLATLTRCAKFMQKPPAAIKTEAWNTPEEEQAVKLADSIQKQVDGALALRRDKKALDKNKTDLLTGLFGETGVFTPTDDELKAKLPAEKKQRLEQMSTELAGIKKSEAAKPLPVSHGLAEASMTNLKVYLRGNPAKLGEEAPRRFLKIIAGDNPTAYKQGSGRLELAESIAAKDNPLTPRVMVNRVWQYHFGRALVGSPSNFGQLGERPTHPELLDYLASRFIESGWSVKTLHREIMRSAAYQLGNDRDEANFTKDGDNRWLWRMNRRRLDVESWRDAMLAVTGKLDPVLGGPTLNLSAGSNNRRTVYAKVSRHDLDHTLRLFDFPDANITSERRNETTVPQQQLFVINSPFVIETAKALATRVQKEESSDEARVQRAFQLAYGRPAVVDEVQLAIGFLNAKDLPGEQAANRLTRWDRLAQIVLGSNEFMYVD